MCAVVYHSRISIKRSCTILVNCYSFYHDIGADISVTSVYHYQQCLLVLYCVVFNFHDTGINVSNLSLIILHGSMLLTCVSEYSEVKQLHICTSGLLFSSEPTLSTTSDSVWIFFIVLVLHIHTQTLFAFIDKIKSVCLVSTYNMSLPNSIIRRLFIDEFYNLHNTFFSNCILGTMRNGSRLLHHCNLQPLVVHSRDRWHVDPTDESLSVWLVPPFIPCPVPIITIYPPHFRLASFDIHVLDFRNCQCQNILRFRRLVNVIFWTNDTNKISDL